MSNNTRKIVAKVTPRSKYYMAGTEGTGEYVTVAVTAVGAVGIREFAPGCYRIRVVPTEQGRVALAQNLTVEGGWKQPGDSDQDRFSKVVFGRKSDETLAAVKKALRAIVAGGNAPTAVNSRAPAFARKLVSHDGLVAALREAKVPGANFAGTWSTAAVCKRITA